MRQTTIALLPALLLTACQEKAPQPKTDGAPVAVEIGKAGGKLVVASWGGPKTFNPIVENEVSSSEFTGYVFASLVDVDAHTGLPRPALAESWTVDSSGKVYRFHLRPGLKFNDGSRLTADDVVFTVRDLVLDTAIQSAIRDILVVDGKAPTVVAIDSLTVEFRLPKVFGPFVSAAGGIPILSKARLSGRTGRGFNSAYGIDTPPDSLVGAGPFKLAKYEGGSRGVFVRNPWFWKKDSSGGALPYLDTILVTVVQDQKAEVLKFKAGEIDAIEVKPQDFPVVKPLEKEGDFTVRKLGPTLASLFLIFNQDTGHDAKGEPLVDPVKVGWFRDVHFRRAVSWAIDRKAIRDIVWNGLGSDANGPFSPSSGYWWNAKLPRLVRNLDSARVELAAGGYAKGADGKLHDAKGNVVKFSLLTNAENQSRIETAGLVRKDLDSLGIEAVFTQVEFNALVSRMDATHDWEVVMLGLTGGGSEPHFGANVWTSSGRTHMWFPRQKVPSTVWERELDSLVVAGVETADTAARKRAYDRLQAVVREEQPLVYLGHPEYMTAVRNRFGNIDPTPLGGALHDIELVYVKK
jgi:peptide/nickel transport system substrate-binding protein